MCNYKYRPPRISTLLLTFFMFMILILAFVNVLEVVKAVGVPFLVVSEQLGLTKQVKRHETMQVVLPGNRLEAEFILDKPGNYVIYSDDTDILGLSDMTEPFINLRDVSSNHNIEVSTVNRGARPYDAIAAKGRPTIRFTTQDAGTFIISAPLLINSATITILPDNVVGHESALNLAYFLQVAIVVGIPTLIILWRQLKKKRQRITERAKKQQLSNEFWQSEIKRSKSNSNED